MDSGNPSADKTVNSMSGPEPALRRLPWFKVIAGVLWVAVWGGVDWMTGPDFGVSAFYLPGIILVAWYAGRLPGVGVALLAALMWLFADLAVREGYDHPLVPYWNAFVRLLMFVVTALLTAEVRERRRMERAYREQKEILESVLDSMADAVVVVENGRVISYNPAAGRFLGGDMLGETVEDWLARVEGRLLDPPSGEDGEGSALRMAIMGKSDGFGEIALRERKEGGKLLLGLTVLPLQGAGKDSAAMVIVAHDLTAKREVDRRIAQAGEREARRIGQDLHDGVCQHLVGVGFALGTLQSDLERHGLPDQADAAGEIASLVREAIGQAKGLARGLFPVGLDEDLDFALSALASSTEQRTGIRCAFERIGGEVVLDSDRSGHVFRIAQEAVFNATQHADPKGIGIRLHSLPEELRLEVTDDGAGIGRGKETTSGIGLQIMRHRANVIGATFEINSRVGVGTSVVCRIPISPEKSAI